MRTPAPHRFEHRINDRIYRIEVSKTGQQWRARVVNAFGQATALMPFDGATPELAADGLASWLSRVNRSTTQVTR